MRNRRNNSRVPFPVIPGLFLVLESWFLTFYNNGRFEPAMNDIYIKDVGEVDTKGCQAGTCSSGQTRCF